MEVKVDIGGAVRKTAILKQIPRAAKKCLTRWGANSVKELKREAAGMKKSVGRKSGQLARAVGMQMTGNVLVVGTNVQRTGDVKYAKVQDEGGEIRAKGKKLTVPFPGVKGRARDYKDTFFITSKAGNVILCQRKGKSGLRPLFTLKDSVYIPASRWFTGTMMRMESLLPGYMDEKVIYAEAEKMTGLGGSA